MLRGGGGVEALPVKGFRRNGGGGGRLFKFHFFFPFLIYLRRLALLGFFGVEMFYRVKFILQEVWKK